MQFKNIFQYTMTHKYSANSLNYCSVYCCYVQSVPYNLNLARGVYDKMMMTILGRVKPNAKM